MSLTIDQLKAAFPRMAANPKTCAALFPHLVKAMDEAKINTRLRICAFLAQVGHESGEFKYMEEIWGPTDAQKRYEPPSSLATKLGNTQPGDGFKFKGRGPIQLTGRSNYKACGAALRLDLENKPELAATNEHAFRVACWFWTKNNINAHADALTGDPAKDCAVAINTPADAKAFDKITKTINGGYNGKADRDAKYAKALKAIP